MAKILIIEDPESLCTLCKTVLRKVNHDIVFGTTGEAGLQAAKNDQPDLIMLDLLLPDISCTEVAQKLRSMSILLDVPRIVTTTLDEIGAQAIADSLDASAVLNKPFRITAMVESLTIVLNASPQNP